MSTVVPLTCFAWCGFTCMSCMRAAIHGECGCCFFSIKKAIESIKSGMTIWTKSRSRSISKTESAYVSFFWTFRAVVGEWEKTDHARPSSSHFRRAAGSLWLPTRSALVRVIGWRSCFLISSVGFPACGDSSSLQEEANGDLSGLGESVDGAS